MPNHIVRLLLLLVGCALVAVTARNLLVDKSFYKYGHYRGDAVAEIARDKPKFQGVPYCQSCHAAQSASWSTGVHDNPAAGKIVKCEVCHGPGGGRDPQQNFINASTGPQHPTNLKLAIPTDTRALCTLCHEKMTGRPVQQAQIVIQDHAGTQQCTLCHDPHSPRTFVGTLAAAAPAGNAAAGKGKAEMCAGCHGDQGISSEDLPGPTLAGQNQAYLAAALAGYKSGSRSNDTMSAMAQSVADGDIADIAAYYSGLKCEGTSTAADQAAADKVAAAARAAGASVCTNCHGADGVSGDHLAPNLVGQSKTYIADALKAYAGGQRSSVVMTALSKSMSDADMDKVAAYFAGSRCK